MYTGMVHYDSHTFCTVSWVIIGLMLTDEGLMNDMSND